MIERKIIKITELIINPNNARFVNSIDEYNEKFAIEALCNDNETNHIDSLLSDIAINNLNANELPVIMESNVYKGKFEVMDGNRRLTCIKLLLQYRDELDKFNIPRVIKNAVKNVKVINVSEEIECIYSDDEIYVNDLLEKLHTHKTGISAVEWKAIAQERHNYKKGKLTKINALVKFLETSKYSDEKTLININKDGWVSKFERFVGNNTTISEYFGFEFSKDLDKIIMFIDEQEIVKGLSQLLQDSIDKKADKFAQKEEDRNKYLYNFRQRKYADMSRINNPVIAYHVNNGYISATLIPSWQLGDDSSKDSNQESCNNTEVGNQPEEKEKKVEITDLLGNESKENKSEEHKTEEQKKENDNTVKSNSAGKGEQSSEKSHKNDTTETRSCLIPRNIFYRVTDQRSVDLLEELQSTPIKGHRNLVAIGFRSFVEFSVTVFIEKKSPNYNKNGKDLIEKIRHTVNKIEAIYGQKVLKNIIPKVYQLLNTSNNTSEFGDIPMLNLFVHHHQFHPQEDELKVIYNNYEPYLKLLWDEINKK